MQELMVDTDRFRRMGQAARQFVESSSFEAAFLKMWAMYAKEHRHIEESAPAAGRVAG
jgi:hypothetical protein